MPDRSSATINGLLDDLLAEYRSNLARVWDLRAEEVFRSWCEEQGDFQHITRRLPKPVHSLIDLGFGYGRLWHLYSSADTKVGVDISGRMLTIAQKYLKNASSLELICADLRSLPFAKGSFQVGLAVRTLNHVSPTDIAQVLSEVRRVVFDHLLIIDSTHVQIDSRLEFIHDYRKLLQEADYSLIELARLDEATQLIHAQAERRKCLNP